MRILVAHNRYLHRGGEDVVFEAETSLLRQYGHELYLWEESNERLQGKGAIGSAIETVWSAASQRKMRELLHDCRPDIVHFHNTFLRISPSAYYACQELGIPVVQTLHNFRLLCPAATLLRDGKICEDCMGHWGFWPSIHHRCWRSSRANTAVVAAMITTHRWLQTWQKQVNLFIALTEFNRQKYIEGGFPVEKIVVKPNFIRLPADRPTSDLPDTESLTASSPPFALYVGRLVLEKGLHILLEAWKSLPDIPLRIAGAGPLRDELVAFAEQNQLTQVEFCGERTHDEILALMPQARFLLVPSIWYEGAIPMTILEAFASHLPVITSKLGGRAEDMEHGKNGLLYRHDDPNDLERWVRWAWEHPKEMKMIADQGYQEYQNKYTASVNYQRLMEIYQQAIAHTTS